jgi:hypothetical protein
MNNTWNVCQAGSYLGLHNVRSHDKRLDEHAKERHGDNARNERVVGSFKYQILGKVTYERSDLAECVSVCRCVRLPTGSHDKAGRHRAIQ